MSDHPTSTETDHRAPRAQVTDRAYPTVMPWMWWVLGGLGVVVLLTVYEPLSIAAVQAYQAPRVSTAKFKINQLGQQVLAEIVLAENPVPARLEDVEGVKPEQLVDPWGRPFLFIVPGPGDTPFDIVSFGRDGKPGGTGRDTDLKYSEL